MGMQMITSWGLPSSSALMISISSAASRTENQMVINIHEDSISLGSLVRLKGKNNRKSIKIQLFVGEVLEELS
jgi:hypothetical protein